MFQCSYSIYLQNCRFTNTLHYSRRRSFTFVTAFAKRGAVRIYVYTFASVALGISVKVISTEQLEYRRFVSGTNVKRRFFLNVGYIKLAPVKLFFLSSYTGEIFIFTSQHVVVFIFASVKADLGR